MELKKNEDSNVIFSIVFLIDFSEQRWNLQWSQICATLILPLENHVKAYYLKKKKSRLIFDF